MHANEGKVSWEAGGASYRNLYRLWQVKLPVGPLLIRGGVLGNEAPVSRNGRGSARCVDLRNSQNDQMAGKVMKNR